MVLELKPMGKPSTQKKKLQVLDKTKALHGPRTQAYGETKYSKEKTTSFGQNQGLAWSSDSSLWGNQVLKRKTTSYRHDLNVIWPLESIRGEFPIDSWANP